MKVIFRIFVVYLMILIGCDSAEKGQSVGNITAIDTLIEQEIAQDHIPGAVIQVKKRDSILHQKAYGYAQKYAYGMDVLEDPELMTTAHLFDLASLTKVTATTFGVMLLVDEGKINVDDPVHNYLPEFSDGDRSKINIRHLLTHTAGLRQWVPTYYHASNSRGRYNYISGVPLKWEVGKARHYSDLGFMLLGDIIRKVTNEPLNQFLQKQLYEKLNLSHTVFNPLDKGFNKIAATSHGNPFEKQMVYDDNFGYTVNVDPDFWNGWRKYTLRGEVNDGNAWYASGGVAGHAGLFSTVSDLQVLVDVLLNKGSYRGKQIISSDIIDRFLSKDQYGNALGWAMDKYFISAEGSPDGTFGHTGFTGTNIVVVPSKSLSIILLTNRQNVGRQENGYYYDLGPLRQAIFHAVMGEVKGR